MGEAIRKYLQLSLEGITSYGSSVLGNYIITYDNVVSYNSLTFGSWVEDKGIGYCTDNDLEYSWVQTGDMFQINKWRVLGISGKYCGYRSVLLLYTQIKIICIFILKYLKQQILLIIIVITMISDDYNASEGSVPFIDGNKYHWHREMHYSYDKVLPLLYTTG